MKLQVYFLSALLFAISCHQSRQDYDSENSINKDSISNIKSNDYKIHQYSTRDPVAENKIYTPFQGVWNQTKDGSGVSFEIIGDSILYEESPEKLYKFQVDDNDIVIYLDGYNIREKLILVNKDSFVILRDSEYITYFKKS